MPLLLRQYSQAHMSFKSCYDATNMLTDGGTSRLKKINFLNRVRVDVLNPLDLRVASSYGLHPTFGSSLKLYIQDLLSAHPTGVKWTRKRETLH